jgi:hypothetical protein
MQSLALDRRLGGRITAVGYLVVLGLLFRDPSRGLAAAGTAQGRLFFLALPASGLLSGVYAAFDGPFGGVGLFIAGSYLAVVGLALAFALVPVSLPVSLLGLVLFGCALTAVLASLRALWGYVSEEQ